MKSPSITIECLRRIAVSLLLMTQGILLAYSASRHSPTDLEPAFLASGISHWQFKRFELYRVNPPLVRMIAALPVLAVGYKADWSNFYDSPGSRAEFPVGEAFVRANGASSIALIIYARWACIPFNILGALIAYCWAKELYGTAAGFVTLTLYVFEPNLLAHGELITPDGACVAFGILAGYAFWRWLKHPTWTRTLLTGAALGLAQLSKMTWLMLFGLWPILWLIWRWTATHKNHLTSNHKSDVKDSQPSLQQLATILVIAVCIINSGYCFDGFGTPLAEFSFVSRTLNGNKTGVPGNRFRKSLFGKLPVPLPKEYVLGFDTQKKDFEHFPQQSYLRGEWKTGGWWYYYLYGLLVKIPSGTYALLIVILVHRTICRELRFPYRDEMILLAPAFVLLSVASSQTAINAHLRYVFPAVAIALIFLSQSGVYLSRNYWFGPAFVASMIGYSLLSSMCTYPNHLAYFNDFIGGPKNGHKHFLGSNLDWGQGILDLAKQINATPQPMHLEFFLRSSTSSLILETQLVKRHEAVVAPQLKCSFYSLERFCRERKWDAFPPDSILTQMPYGCAKRQSASNTYG